MSTDSSPAPATTVIPGVTLTTGAGGLPAVAIDTPLASALLYLNGAHLARWRPRGHDEVLWLSSTSQYLPGKPIRGGVPLCWPWFGGHAQRPELPAHGFARTSAWTLAASEALPDGRVRIGLSLADDADSSRMWPHPFIVTFAVTVGETLEMELTVRNPGSSPFTCEEALHTYFSVGDARRCAIHGLAGTTYIDKVRALQRFVEGAAPIAFTGETDRVYVDTGATCRLEDPVLKRTISIAKSGSKATVVWNPWIVKAKAMKDFDDEGWTGMACIESANAADAAITVAPGDEHRLAVQISVQRCS